MNKPVQKPTQTTIHVSYPEPHIGRTKEILKKHPEIRTLMGHNPWTALIMAGIVTTQMVAAALLANAPWWAILAVAWTLGAVNNHALFVVIHDAAHNLVFKSSFWNKVVGIASNICGVFPSAIGFRNFHLLHHRYQGEFGWDADLAGPKEAALVGNSTFRKILWFLAFGIIEGVVRPARVKKVNLFEPWAIVNVVVAVGSAAAMTYFFGWGALAYLALSFFFSVGLHPLGGRWIQEHYVFKEGQETYSYYGPLNWVSLNVGYHNEHHDFMMIPWNKLPALKRMAPEYYDTLMSHKSWTGVWLRFIFDRNLSLYSRVTRDDHEVRRKAALDTRDTQLILDEARTVAGAPAGAAPVGVTNPEPTPAV